MLQLEVIGNIGNDAVIKEFSGNKYVSFNVASSESHKDANGNKVETTTWVSVLMYGDGGGLLQYLKRGTKVFVRGKMRAKVYSDKSNVAQCAINVMAGEVNLCGVRGENNNASGNANAAPAASVQQPADDLPF